MTAATFKAAMIQMRSGMTPDANIDAAVKLIGEARSAGAEYVQTPEMTNLMEVKRERLFAAIVEEEADASLATLREVARKLALTSSAATTRSTCSTSTSPAAKATASRAPTAPASRRCCAICRGAASA
jgi:predicted amidohydrolase